jgi:hypothetical protein
VHFLGNSYVLAAILASGEGEPKMRIHAVTVSRSFMLFLGLMEVLGSVAMSLAWFTKDAELSITGRFTHERRGTQ